jgi:hypothetical protein
VSGAAPYSGDGKAQSEDVVRKVVATSLIAMGFAIGWLADLGENLQKLWEAARPFVSRPSQPDTGNCKFVIVRPSPNFSVGGTIKVAVQTESASIPGGAAAIFVLKNQPEWERSITVIDSSGNRVDGKLVVSATSHYVATLYSQSNHLSGISIDTPGSADYDVILADTNLKEPKCSDFETGVFLGGTNVEAASDGWLWGGALAAAFITGLAMALIMPRVWPRAGSPVTPPTSGRKRAGGRR